MPIRRWTTSSADPTPALPIGARLADPLPSLFIGGGRAIALSARDLMLAGPFLARRAIVMLPHHAPGDVMPDNQGGRR
jgi:hypothetical protein